MRLTSAILAVICAWALVACAPPPVAPVTPVTSSKPPVAPSAVNTLGEAMTALRAAELEAERTRQNLDRAQDNLNKANTSLRATVEQASKLAKQKSATEAELVDLYNRMVEQEKAYLDLTKDFDATTASLAAERALRTQITAKLSEAERKAAVKDSEASELRRLLDTSERTAAATDKAMRDYQTAAADAVAKADSLKGQNKLLFRALMVTGSLLLLCIIIAAARVYRKVAFPL